MHQRIKERLKYSPLSRIAGLPLRFYALSSTARRLALALAWFVRSREWANVSYDLAPDGVRSMAAAIGLAANIQPQLVREHAKELLADDAFSQRYRQRVTGTRLRYTNEPRLYLGKCLIYYMLIRATRPRLVVEAGTLNGLGSLAICRALARNAGEGAPGRLVTIDVATDRGEFLDGDEGGLVTRLTGDSVAAIAAMDTTIDCFIHDTTSDAAHVREQFSALEPKLAQDGVVFTVWFVEEFVLFCERARLAYLEVVDRPLDHWYTGMRCGLASGRMMRPSSTDDRVPSEEAPQSPAGR